ncbi:UDP-forming cellulose synthase catalytic subunit [Pararhodobacter oceanensis]|uniref:UDP-forming cellulose synthase catalytic subunit n=1 Tax=Pararhodobacter oceanensis TaxID=2172121 RepID=UPI001F0CC204|nr:UDP-forming cellulose synthase catalytic subunit [Pararhodobacter oceanensis]
MNLILWILVLGLIAALVSVPTSIQVQATLGIASVIVVAALKPVAMDSMVARFAMMSVASTLVMRYWAWRVTETLPPIDDPISFIPAIFLFFVETYAIAVFFLSGFMTADPIKRGLPPKVAARDLPTVDILVPSYNEPIEMLAVTLSAAKNMHYPAHKRTVILCDDGGTDQRCNHENPEIAEASRKRRRDMIALCNELGVVYSTRPRNEHAKAGNMSAALEKQNGELVVVFDADHVPSRDFLARTVGYFVEDPKLFLVQTPHFFLNPDPIDRNVGFRDDCPPENEMFYHLSHRGLDRWGGAFFCGSAAVLRRQALDEAGGFAGDTITEDAETALQIHRNGWKSIYVDHAMIAGLQPETFVSFIEQRGRWATGMMQLLILKNPLRGKGLSFTQRLCYLNSMTFWLFPLVRMTFILAPLAYLFFGLQIFVATIEEVAVYMTSYMAVNFMIQNALYGKVRWPLISEIYETAQAPYLSKAIFKTVANPRGAKFNVTAKDEILEEDFVSPIYKPLVLIFVLTLLGVVAAAVRWFLYPGDHNIIMVVGGWAVYNFLLVGAALRAISERQQRRQVPRVPTNISATVALGGNTPVFQSATVVDASTSGCRIVLRPRSTPDGAASPLPVKGETFYFTPEFPKSPHLENAVRVQVQSVIREGDSVAVGVRFDPAQPMVVRETVAHMIFGDSASWEAIRATRNKKMGLIVGMLYVLKLSVEGIVNTLRALADEPARLKRVAAREEKIVVVESQPAHLLAFGEAFDPPPSGRPVSLLQAAIAQGQAPTMPGAHPAQGPQGGSA